jgi:excisionase family DNA binding protein
MPAVDSESRSEKSSTNRAGEGSANWLTPSEAARYLRVQVRTVLLWARQGRLKGYVLSGLKRRAWRFRQTDLDAALLEGAVIPSELPSVRPAERMEQ